MKPKEIVAKWWSDNLEPEDKREAFREALLKRLPDEGEYSTWVDYDPEGPLLEALRDVGIKCAGVFFSADNLLPRKTGIIVQADGKVMLAEYGQPWVELSA